MGDIATELVRWAPPSLVGAGLTALAFVVWKGGAFVVGLFGRRWATVTAAAEKIDRIEVGLGQSDRLLVELSSRFTRVEQQVSGLAADIEKRITVTAHSASMNQIWDDHNKLEREFAEYKAEQRTEARVRKEYEDRLAEQRERT